MVLGKDQHGLQKSYDLVSEMDAHLCWPLADYETLIKTFNHLDPQFSPVKQAY
jgi:hypothetical protein